jgi:SAM-dependent methyltransferase
MDECKSCEIRWWEENIDAENELKKPYRNAWELMIWRKTMSVITSHYKFAHKKVFVGCCGTGLFEAEIIKYDPSINEIIGLDITPKFIELARIRNKDNGKMKFIVGDLENLLDFADQYFDIAVIIDGLHHIPRPVVALAELKRISKDVILCEPNALNPIRRFNELKFRNQGVKESSFYEARLIKWLRLLSYSSISVFNINFIPQFIPVSLLPCCKVVESFVENIPLIKKIGGGLIIISRS